MKTVIERTSKRAASILLRRAPLLATACMLASLAGVDVQAQSNPTSASGGKRPFIIMLVDTSASMEFSLNSNKQYACNQRKDLGGGDFESCSQGLVDSSVNPNIANDPNAPINFLWENSDLLGDSDSDPLDRTADWDDKDYENPDVGPTFVGPCYVWKDQCSDYSRPPWSPDILEDGENNNDEDSYDMDMWQRLRLMRGRHLMASPSSLAPMMIGAGNEVRRLNDSNQPRHVQLKEILTGDMILSPFAEATDDLAKDTVGFVANAQIHGPGCWFVPRMQNSRSYQGGWHACQQIACTRDSDCNATASGRRCTGSSGSPGICVDGALGGDELAVQITCTSKGDCDSVESGLECTGDMGNPGVCVRGKHPNAMQFFVDRDDPRPHFQEVYDYQLNTGLLDNLASAAIFAVAMFDGYQGRSQNLMDPMSDVVDANSANPISPIINDGIPDTGSATFAQSPPMSLTGIMEGTSKYDLGIYKVIGPTTLDIPTSQLSGLSQFTQYAIADAGYLRNHKKDKDAEEWLIDPASSKDSRLSYSIPSGLDDYTVPFQMGHQPIAGGTPLAAAIRDIHMYMLRGQYEFDYRGRAQPSSVAYDPELHSPKDLADDSDHYIINPVQQDKYRECRPKHVVLMTDGFPSPEVGASEAGELNLGANELGDNFGFPDATNRYVYLQTEREIEELVNDPALTPSDKPYQNKEDFMPFVHIVGLNLIDDSLCVDDSDCRGGLVCSKLNGKSVCAVDEDNDDVPDVPQKMGRMAAAGRTCAQYFLVKGDGKKYVPSTWPAMTDEGGASHTGTCNVTSGNCLVQQFSSAEAPDYKGSPCLAPALILEKNDSKGVAAPMMGDVSVRDDLTEALSLVFNDVLEQANGIASRTRATVTNNLDDADLRGQYRIFSGTNVAGSSVYWHGLLERQTLACGSGGGGVASSNINDSLHLDLNKQVEVDMVSPTGYRDNRRIFTMFPDSGASCSNCNSVIGSTSSLESLTASEDQFEGTRFGNAGAALKAMTRVPLVLEDMLSIRGVSAVPTTSDLSFLNVVDEADGVRTIAEVRGHIPQKQGRILGAVLNSNPVTVGPPSLNLPNASYRAYRERYGQRATMLYVSTLDGMLHAIHTGPHDGPDNGIIRRSMSGGEGSMPQAVCSNSSCDSSQREAWAYVPNMLLTELPNYKNRQPNLMDGSPVVNDVRLCHGDGTLNQNEQACASAGATVAPEDQWRSVLVQGLGQAGAGYFALDVTHSGGVIGGSDGNIPDPIPLWEVNPAWELEQIANLSGQPTRFGFSAGSVANSFPNHSSSDTGCSATPSNLLETSFMGQSVGEPAIGTVVLDGIKPGGGVQRPVAIFSGGLNGSIPGSDDCLVNDRRGRAVYVVDLQTGTLLRRFVDYNSDGTYYRFEAEVAGTPVLYDNRPGVVASRAFVGDLAGRLFRIDLSGTDPSDWKMELFYDPCSDSQVDTGDSCDLLDGTELRDDSGRTFGPAMFPPTVALDSQRRPTVVYGLGERNDTSTANQIQAMVALRDNVDPSDKIAWSTTFPENTSEDYNEKLTGQPVIFNFGVYFTTYRENSKDSCEPGRSRIWGLRLGGDPEDPGKIAGALDFSASDSTALTQVDWPSDQDPATDLLRWYSPTDPLLIRGVTIAFRPSCNIDFDNPGVNTDEGEEATPELIATTGASDGASSNNYNNNDPGDFSSGTAGSLSFEIKKLATPRSRLEPLSWSVIGY